MPCFIMFTPTCYCVTFSGANIFIFTYAIPLITLHLGILKFLSFYAYNAGQAISDYLRPSCKTVYTITDTQSSPPNLASLTHSKMMKKIFLMIANRYSKTIGYIIEQLYVYNKIKPIRSKLIFKRRLLKLGTK